MSWLFLAVAILAEVSGTLGLRAISDSGTWWPIVLVVISYAASFTALTVSLRRLNVAIVYAI